MVVNILHVSDMHLEHEWFDWVSAHCVQYDLLVIAGDLQNAFSRVSLHEQAKAVSNWLIALQVPTCVCSGNHDFWVSDPRVTIDAYSEAAWLRRLRGKGNIIGVDGDVIKFGGLTLAVNGWLQVPHIDHSVDLLVTHAPVAGCAAASGPEGRDVGDPELWRAVCGHPPRLAILAGHVHSPRKHACRWPPIDPTSLVLVPGFGEEAVPHHWIIDTVAGIATHSSGEQVALA